jgi:hypothetical protein
MKTPPGPICDKMETVNEDATKPSGPADGSQKPVSPAISNLKAHWARKDPMASFWVKEVKFLVIMLVVVAAMVAAVAQYRWNQIQNQREVEEKNRQHEERRKAQSAAPQPGQVTPEGVVLWDNMLAQEVDDAPLDDVVADRGFKYLIRHLANMKVGEALGASEDFDDEDLLKNPAHHRGRVVSLYGLVNKVYTNIRLETNQGPFDSVYRIYLADLSGRWGAIVDVLDRPDGIDERSAVECEAIFVRTVKYETANGRSARVPYFVARGVRQAQRPAGRTIWNTKVALAVGGVALAVVLLIFLTGRTGTGKKRDSEATATAFKGAEK